MGATPTEGGVSENQDLAAAMPRILVLDDEDSQRRTIHHQLADLHGEFFDFGDPREAIAFLREHAVDAVVADIRMPKLPVDGLWFLAELRRMDREVGVVLRTGDEAVEIAQAGIEARAIQRVIKSAPASRVRLQDAVQAAVTETRARRSARDAAREVERTRDELVQALGRTEDEITVAEMCRGFVQGLNNHVTTLGGYSELFVEAAERVRDPQFIELAQKNRSVAHRLSTQVGDFLGNPYFEAATAVGAGVNACVDALAQVVRSHPLFGPGRCTFSAKGILPDAIFAANPQRTLTALRHLVEYCALRANRPGIELAATVCANNDAELRKNDGLVINRRWAPKRAGVIFTVRAEIGTPSLEEIRQDLRRCSQDPRVGNLLVVGATIVDEHLAFSAAHSPKTVTTFALYLPASS